MVRTLILALLAGEKTKQRQEDAGRMTEIEHYASSSYAAPQRQHLDECNSIQGAPWGTLSLGFIVQRGHAADSEARSKRSTPSANCTSSSRTHYSG